RQLQIRSAEARLPAIDSILDPPSERLKTRLIVDIDGSRCPPPKSRALLTHRAPASSSGVEAVAGNECSTSIGGKKRARSRMNVSQVRREFWLRRRLRHEKQECKITALYGNNPAPWEAKGQEAAKPESGSSPHDSGEIDEAACHRHAGDVR